MSDLVSGRYPDSDETWMLDGQPVPPYRRTTNRATGSSVTLVTTTLYVFPVVVQAGDIFAFLSFIAKTQAGATSSHAWAALYNGVGTGAALLAQTADTAAGWTAGATKLALGSTVQNVGTVGTAQGPSTAAVTAQGPAVWGVALYNVTSGTGNILDAAGTVGSSSQAGEQAISTQVPLCSTATVSTTATAPPVLPTMTAASFGIPYVVLSRS